MTQCQKHIKVIYMLVSIVILGVCAYFNIDYKNGVGNSINEVYFGQYPLLFVASGVSGSALVLFVSSLFKIHNVRFLESLSNSNVIILGFHCLVMMYIYSFVGGRTEWYVAVVICAVTFVICAFIGRILKRYAPSYLGWR